MKKIIILTAIVFLACAGLSFAAQNSITTYLRAGNMANELQGSQVQASDFVQHGTSGSIAGSLATNNLTVGNNLNDTAGSIIYGGDSDVGFCANGVCNFGIGIRVYFEFTFETPDTSSNSQAQADGFTFFLINGTNNSSNSTGGAPVGTSMGELLGYGGPGVTDGNGLQPPKMGIEFDTYPNSGTGSICQSNSRNDAPDNHMALMFWGNNNYGTTTCSGGGLENRYDDNVHGAGTSTDPPVNSMIGDGLGGYYSVAKGTSTYNWLEDGQLHRFRMEVTRATVPVNGTYAYNIKAWVDCGYNSNSQFCPTAQLTAYQNLTTSYSSATNSIAPQINRTVNLTAANHTLFNTILFGFGYATGGSTDTIAFQNFNVYFPVNNCGYGATPTSATYGSSGTGSTPGNISVFATSGCQWTATSDSPSWLTLTACGSGTLNSGTCTETSSGTVTYNVAANNCPARSGNINYGDSITTQAFNVTQSAGTPLAITTASLPSGRKGVAYTSTTMAASGGLTPYTWSSTGLPAGLTMTSAGVISGTPTTQAPYTPTITVTDSCPQTANQTYSVCIKTNGNYTIYNSTGATIYRQSGTTCTNGNSIVNGGTYAIAYNGAAVTFYSSRGSGNACQGTSISISGAQAEAVNADCDSSVQINSSWQLVDY